MRAAAHALAGLAVASLWLGADMSDPIHAAAVAVACVVAALAPDCDHPRSPAGRILHVPVGHRSPWTHSLVPAAVVGCAFLSYPPLSFLAFPVGASWLVHVAIDGLTRSGVPMLWPLSSSPVRLAGGPLRVGTSDEVLIAAAAAVFALIPWLPQIVVRLGI